jgi:hypothetical protein
MGAILEGLIDLKISDQLDHVRSIFGLVRVAYVESRWREALEHTNKALIHMQRYRAFSVGNFYIGIALAFAL